MSSAPSSNADTACATWAAKVASFADLPDERLNARLASTLATLAAKPTSSIPQAAGDWQKAKPIYRFFANERVGVADLLQPIAAATVADAGSQAVIYVVQDTTSLNYSHLRQTTGLGLLNDSPTARGLHWHSTLALRSDGVPLGLLDQQWWIRPPGQRHAKNHKRRRLEHKESMKWLRGIQASQAVLERLPLEKRPRLSTSWIAKATFMRFSKPSVPARTVRSSAACITAKSIVRAATLTLPFAAPRLWEPRPWPCPENTARRHVPRPSKFGQRS